MVAARHLTNLGCEVCLMLVGDPNAIRTEEARVNWNICCNLRSIKVEVYSSLEDFLRKLNWADIIVDAMLGTGVKGELREPFLSIVKNLNESGKAVVAVDTPTRSGSHHWKNLWGGREGSHDGDLSCSQERVRRKRRVYRSGLGLRILACLESLS